MGCAQKAWKLRPVAMNSNTDLDLHNVLTSENDTSRAEDPGKARRAGPGTMKAPNRTLEWFLLAMSGRSEGR